MSDSILHYILKLKEFRGYLSSLELIELSMSSKKLRDLLKSSVFNSFNFECFVGDKKYKSGFITSNCEEFNEIYPLLMNAGIIKQSDNERGFEYVLRDEYVSFIRNPYKPLTKGYLESRDKMQFDVKQFPFRPKKLKLHSTEGRDYLIYDLCSAFSNLKILSIYSSIIKFEVVQHLLDNLECLEDLSLDNNIIFKSSKRSNKCSISWPLNLKKLMIGDNEFGIIDNDDDYVKSYNSEDPQINSYDFNIKPKYLPNLHTLILRSRISRSGIRYAFYESDNEDLLLAFLKLNPQVKNLEICFPQFNPDSLKTISSLRSLIKLKLTIYDFEDIETFKTIKAPTLSSLKWLELSITQDTSIFAAIVRQFPNLEYLSYYFERLRLNNQILYELRLEKLEKLKALKLVVHQNEPLNNLYLPRLKNLESLEVYNGKSFNLDLLINQSDLYPKLKVVKFTKVQNGIIFDQPNIGQELNSHFRFLIFPYALSLYKLNK